MLRYFYLDMFSDKDDDLTIPVTLDVAKLMYTCIKTASRKGQVRVHSDQQLMEGNYYTQADRAVRLGS